MRAVVQRVSSAAVSVNEVVVGKIGKGLLVLLGIHLADTEGDALWLIEKISGLRVFEDDVGKMNLSVLECQSSAAAATSRSEPSVLVVSQFTLIASTKKGNRPSFNHAAKPVAAIPLYEFFLRELEKRLGCPVARGTFGAMMAVSLTNDGPVTLVLDSILRE